MSTSLLLALCTALPAPEATDIERQAAALLGLTQVSVQRLDLPLPTDPGTVEVELEGLPFTLELAPFSIRAEGFQVWADIGGVLERREAGPVRTVRGSVLEDPGSRVVGSLLDEGLHASVELSTGERYWIQPLQAELSAAHPTDHAVYHDADVLPVAGIRHDSVPVPGGVATPGSGSSVASPGNLYNMEIGCDAEYTYYLRWGNVTNTVDRMEANIHLTNPEFEDEAQIRHLISVALVRTTPGAGGYVSDDSATFLQEVRSEWLTNQTHLHRDQVVAFTDRLPSGFYSNGYIGAVCTSFAFGWVNPEAFPHTIKCRMSHTEFLLGTAWSALSHQVNCWAMKNPSCCGVELHPTLSVPNILAHRDSRTCLDQRPNGTVVYIDDFESGDFAAGGWTVSSPQRCKVLLDAAYEGVYGARLIKGGVGTGKCKVGTKPSWIQTPAIDTTGYAEVFVELGARLVQTEVNCENLSVQWSTDGFLWQEAGAFSTRKWTTHLAQLPAEAAGQPTVYVRLVSNAKGKGEYMNVDGVCVIAQ